MKVLVTGITGLVGAEIGKTLLAKGFKVRALVRETSDLSALSEVLDQIEIVKGDILDVLSLEKALENIDTVIHTAAIVSFAPKDRADMYKVNIEGTANVVNLCLIQGVSKLIFISSIASLGRPTAHQTEGNKAIEISESQKWEDSDLNSHYAKTKYLAECEVWRGEAEGLKVVVLNLSIVLGAGDWTKSSTRLFKYVFDQKPFYTPGYINYVDVKDVAALAALSLGEEVYGQRFVVSAGNITYADFFKEIAIRFHKNPPSKLLGPRSIAILWRIEAFRSFVFGTNPLITKETAKTAQTQILYKNNKAEKYFDFEFKPLNQTLDEVCGSLLKEYSEVI
jgi:dihydroflavonol-4-reductase